MISAQPTSDRQAPASGPGWSLDHADCLDWLRTLPPAAADACVTDPPYGISYHSRVHGKVLNDAPGAPFVWWMHDAAKALRPGAPLVCFCRWDVAEAFRLALVWAGLTIRSCIVWDRQIPGSGDTRRTFAPSHDFLWLATKGDWVLPGLDTRLDEALRPPVGERRPRDVMNHPKLRYSQCSHPTEKPVPLLRRLVRSITAPGAQVLDPFAGSGSTGEACLLEGRTFKGCELDESHWRTARARLSSL